MCINIIIIRYVYLRDKVTILRMYHSNGANLLTCLESLDQLWISEHKHVAIRHKHFEATDTVVLRQRLHVLFDLRTNEAVNNEAANAASFRL